MDIWLIFGVGLIGFLVCLVILFAWRVWPSVIGAMYTPTPIKTVRQMLQLAEVTSKDTVYDLGSGDGRIPLMAAQEFGANSVGIEADPLRAFWSKKTIQREGLGNKVKIIRANFFNVGLNPASVVTVFQGQKINQRLKDKFLKELNTGTRIISRRFTFNGWHPVKVDENRNLFVYIIR